MNTPKKFRVWLPSLNKFGDDNSVFMDCYGKLYGVTRPSLVDDSRSIVNIGQFKEFDGYTIQWYTGLNDKNSNPIYEGDIVKFSRLFEKERKIKELKSFVRFDEGKFGFDLIGFNGMFYDLSDEFSIEVIGNIFEHSELLK